MQSVKMWVMGSIHIYHHRTGSADNKQGSILRDMMRKMYLQLVASKDGGNSFSTMANEKTMEKHGMGLFKYNGNRDGHILICQYVNPWTQTAIRIWKYKESYTREKIKTDQISLREINTRQFQNLKKVCIFNPQASGMAILQNLTWKTTPPLQMLPRSGICCVRWNINEDTT